MQLKAALKWNHKIMKVCTALKEVQYKLNSGEICPAIVQPTPNTD